MTTSHTTASSRAFFTRYLPLAALASLTALASPALAADSWVTCEGTVATTTTKDGKTETTNASATDVYAYNDASKALFKYSDKRKTLDPVFVTGFDDKAIKWANAGASSAGSSAASWEGAIDRATLALKLTRTERGEVMTWTQQCKATSPKI